MMSCIRPLAFLIGAAVAAGCTSSNNPLIGRVPQVAYNVDPSIPKAIRAPQGHLLLGHATGRGVATFTVQSDPRDPDHLVWVPTSDEGGDLLDYWGNVVGHHQGTTLSARNGASLTAQTVAQVPMHGQLPWSLMEATGHEGHGMLSSAEYVEQLHTVGGPPAPAANAGLGSVARAEYSADYYFYGPLR